MPVLSRRQPLLDLRSKTTGTMIPESEDDLKASLWLAADDAFKAPPKEEDFPAHQLKSSTRSHSNLRLRTQASLHERYQSSEEEASPSPEDYTSSADESSLSKPTKATSTTAAPVDPGLEIPSESEDDFDTLPTTIVAPTLAVTVSILNAGRPKLISIAAFAPIQKRKRSALSPVTTSMISTGRSTRMNSTVSTTTPASPTSPSPPRKRSNSRRALPSVPTPRLPKESHLEVEERMSLSEEEEADQLLHAGDSAATYTAQADLDSVPSEQEGELYESTSLPPTTYAEYDPYSLNPPRLPGGHDFGSKKSSSARHRTKSDSDSIRSVRGKQGWRGFGKSLGLMRKERVSGSTPPMKGKDKPVARGAAEREEAPLIPAFGFEE
ncbi:hypothetical protein MMC13_002192 [Lambiella insularis]|nr:hypothetical protein [Lambiella insularis]